MLSAMTWQTGSLRSSIHLAGNTRYENLCTCCCFCALLIAFAVGLPISSHVTGVIVLMHMHALIEITRSCTQYHTTVDHQLGLTQRSQWHPLGTDNPLGEQVMISLTAGPQL